MSKPRHAKESMLRNTGVRELRLSARDANIISAGLLNIASAYAAWDKDGSLPVERWKLDYFYAKHELVQLDREMMTAFTECAPRVESLKLKGGRLKCVHVFSIEALIFAVRFTRKLIKHGHLKTRIEQLREVCDRLLKKLEKHRKRQKRAAVAQHGPIIYRQHRATWQNTITLLRKYLLKCNCGVRLPLLYNKSRRKWLDQLEEWAREELTQRGYKLPEKCELRRLVRLLVRYVQRGRVGVSLPFLLTNKDVAMTSCGDFVLRRSNLKLRARVDPTARPTMWPHEVAALIPKAPAYKINRLKLSSWRAERLAERARSATQITQPPVTVKAQGEYLGQIMTEVLDAETLWPVDRELVLHQVDRNLWNLRRRGARFGSHCADPIAGLRRCQPPRPASDYVPDVLNFLIEWLTNWLLNVAGSAKHAEDAIGWALSRVQKPLRA